MIKIIISAFLTTGLLANVYSIQFYCSKNMKYAKIFLKKTVKDGFLYKTNSGYWTVRSRVFNSFSEARKHIKKYGLHNVSIVPLDARKLYANKIIPVKKFSKKRLKSKTKSVNDNYLDKKYLTPCTQCNICKCVNQKYGWEINQTKLFQNIHLNIKQAVAFQELTKTEQITAKPFCYNRLLRFYTNADIAAIKGQTPTNSQILRGAYEKLRVGLQYGCHFNDFKFYTDSRIILYAKQQNSNNQSDIALEVKELYLQSYNILQNRFDFIIGRKQIKDCRSWICDNSFDVVELFNMHNLWTYQAILGTKFNNDKIITNESLFINSLKDTKFFILKGDYQYYINRHLSAFFIRENTTNYLDRDLNWLTVRNYADFQNFKYWIDFSKSSGKNYIQNLDGYAYEAGIMYLPQTKKYSIGVGYASSQKTYTQPIMADNKSNFLNKHIKLRYYGIFLDPELSNLDILSLYWFYDYSPKKTFAIMFHNYKQHKLSNNLNYTSYMANPNNRSQDIGNEIDFIYKFAISHQYSYKFGFAYFKGGDAFSNVTTRKDGLYAKFNFLYYW